MGILFWIYYQNYCTGIIQKAKYILFNIGKTFLKFPNILAIQNYTEKYLIMNRLIKSPDLL